MVDNRKYLIFNRRQIDDPGFIKEFVFVDPIAIIDTISGPHAHFPESTEKG